MNDSRQYEETIDLLAVMVKALRKWRVLLAAMVIGAALLGGYKMLGPVDNTSAIEGIETKIEGIETQIEAIETKIKPTQTEMDKNLETHRTNERTIETRRGSIERDKKTIVKDKEMISVQKGELARWEEMLVPLESSLKETQDMLADPSLTAEQHADIVVQLNSLMGNVLNVSARSSTAKQQISNLETEIEKLENEIETFEEDIKDLLEKNGKLQEQIDKQEETTGKRGAEIEKLEAEIEELEAQLPDLSAARAGLKTVLKYAILGAVLGAFVFCGVIFLQFILDRRLRASVDLKERYNFPILGEFSSEDAKKHGKFGQWMDKLSGDVQTLPEEQQVYELIAAGVRTSVEELPVHLAVTGTVSRELLDQIGGQLKSLLPNTYGIKVETNPVYNAAFLADLKQYTVLLVEAKGVSDRREIDKLAEVLCRNKVKVVGAVVK